MGVHEGHRYRLKQRFLRGGLDGFEEHEVLELLLFYAIPQRDVNPLAHTLLERFGSLARVLDAPREELAAISGVGDNAATLLKLMPQLSRRYLVSAQEQGVCVDSPEKAAALLRPRFVGERDEVVYLLCLDAALRVKGCELLCRGSVTNVEVDLRKLVERALSVNATDLILAHNHLSGLAVPSVEDCDVTERVAAALALMNIRLCDHIIVAGGDYVSLAASGSLPRSKWGR